MVILRLDSQNRMVTKGYRRRLYEWVEALTEGVGSGDAMFDSPNYQSHCKRALRLASNVYPLNDLRLNRATHQHRGLLAGI
jgi:hypothetical protein